MKFIATKMAQSFFDPSNFQPWQAASSSRLLDCEGRLEEEEEQLRFWRAGGMVPTPGRIRETRFLSNFVIRIPRSREK